MLNQHLDTKGVTYTANEVLIWLNQWLHYQEKSLMNETRIIANNIA